MPDDPKARLHATIEKLTRKLVDEGLLVEAGWQMHRLIACQGETSVAQLDLLHETFFAGAQHLFGSIMSMLDPGVEETPNDLRRMDQIHAELGRFTEAFGKKHANWRGPTTH